MISQEPTEEAMKSSKDYKDTHGPTPTPKTHNPTPVQFHPSLIPTEVSPLIFHK